VKLGLLSTANINAMLIAGAPDEVELAAVGSRDASRAEEYARENGITRAHGSYEALLADDDLDAVYISLPNGLHHEWTLKALEAGKHVLCEKPYSRRPNEVEEAWDAADAAGLVLMEAFMYRHHPQAEKARALVADGAIGRLRTIRATFSFRLDDHSNIRMSAELDGGALMDVGCYCVSGSRLLGGEPEHVFAEQVVGPTGVDVDFNGTLRFPNDVIAQFDSSFSLPKRQRLEAVGEKGTLVVEAPWRADWGGRVLVNDEAVPVEQADS
jgi:D-xylose 1-dehydrogenase (NADP+, D-xylono-1,5-lactone-forming)